MRLIQSIKTAESNKDNNNKDNITYDSSNCTFSSNINDIIFHENDIIMSDSFISDEESEYEFTKPSQVTDNYNYHARKIYRSELDKLNLGIPLTMSKTRSGKVNH